MAAAAASATIQPAGLDHLPPYMRERLPFFVYGTLQTGFRNHVNVVKGRARFGAAARLTGAHVWHYTAGFPGMYEEGAPADAVVHGQLLTMADDSDGSVYDGLLFDLDVLEEYFGPGHPANVYERVARSVTVEAAGDGEGEGGGAGAAPVEPRVVRAWVYLSKIDRAAAGAVRVPHGDWRRFMAQHGLDDAGDDWARTLAARDAAMAVGAGAAAAPGEGAEAVTLGLRPAVDGDR